MQSDEWLWVVQQMDQALTEPERAGEIIRNVQGEALRRLSTPPKDLLGMVRYQQEMNGKTLPRAWALSLYVRLAHLYYRRKASHGTVS